MAIDAALASGRRRGVAVQSAQPDRASVHRRGARRAWRRSSSVTARASWPTRCTRRSCIPGVATCRTRPCRTRRAEHTGDGDLGVEGVQPRGPEVRAGHRDESRRRGAVAGAARLRGPGSDPLGIAASVAAYRSGGDVAARARRVPRRQPPAARRAAGRRAARRVVPSRRTRRSLRGSTARRSASTTRRGSFSTTRGWRSATGRRSGPDATSSCGSTSRPRARCSNRSSARWAPPPPGPRRDDLLYEPSAEVAAIRGRIDHPIIDADGHIIEYLPLVRDILVELAGESVAQRFDLVVDSGRVRRCSRRRNGASWR